MTKRFNISFLRSLTIFHYMAALFVVSGVVFAVFFFSRQTKMIYVDLSFFTPDWSTTPVPPEYTVTNAIHEGDLAYDGFGNKIATVVEKKSIDWAGTTRLISMVVQLRAYYNSHTKQYSYGDNPILIGNGLSLTIGNVAFQGRIVNIYTSPGDRYNNYKKTNAVVTLLLRHREPFWAEAVKTFEAKNSKGEVIARALNVAIEPEEVDVPTDAGYIKKGYSTIYKDVTVDLALYGVLCAENSCYFNNTVDLKLGSETFYLQSDKTYISNGKIVNVTYNTTDASR